LTFDQESRVNTFAHVNHSPGHDRLGVLLCINGTGILNRWVKNLFSPSTGYPEMNREASAIKAGAEGLRVLPFGNGAERMLGNRLVGAHFHNIDLNLHTQAHLYRATQEGIAFAFRYGLDIMRENGMNPTVIRAGMANLFLSELFIEAFVNATGVPVELYQCDGSVGAAIGAGIGVQQYKSSSEAFAGTSPIRLVEPTAGNNYETHYQSWLGFLQKELG
jgi:xylulokinase